MVRKTMKMLVVALIAAFALSSMAEAAPKKMVRQRAKHSSGRTDPRGNARGSVRRHRVELDSIDERVLVDWPGVRGTLS